ncbi:sigma-E processing peptidase SpoIIGA [Paenibacillus sp. J2TS4]|uniref:sigma-E processing peptidase SpoIIGA n=1 Tax=Paenibacillus sp. J2TS4 TaxID=2807194 RepID=UPI001B0E4164|nr:sigma-E processing peptidase SpoIIGA [Paenibacillus sp. J2TS4]GIP36397.1 sporulation sigma-E factor-processing peptidase [Paenibacillus sp. J2TS4]
MVVYLDLIFLFNFIIDGALLLTTAWTRKLEIRWLRVAASAAIGASYTVFMLIPELSVLYTFVAKLFFSVSMMVTAFPYRGLIPLVRNLGTFYVVNFVAAGGIYGLHYFFLSSLDVMNGIMLTQSGGIMFPFQIRLWLVGLSAAFILFFYLRIFRSAKKNEELTSFLAEVIITIDDFTITCKGLIDTGNRLYEPLTKTPVMVVEASLWGDRLPESWIRQIRSFEVDQIVSTMREDEFEWQDRLRLVPYRGINNATQFMLAIKPDEVSVGYHDTNLATRKVLIGLDAGKLSADGSYEAIIHPDLIAAEEEGRRTGEQERASREYGSPTVNRTNGNLATQADTKKPLNLPMD